MTTTSEWMARKLGNHAPPPQIQPYGQQPPSGYYTQQPQQQWAPQYQQPQQYVQNYPHPQPYPPQQYQQQGPPLTAQGRVDLNAMEEAGLSLKQVAKMWRGGEATRTETDTCPRCGSGHYFSNRGSVQFNATSGQSSPPKPTCFTCGYPSAQGDAGNWSVSG